MDSINYRRLAELRERMGLTQTELADKVYVTCQMINQVEHGVKTPSVPLLKRIAAVLGVPAADLM